MGAVKEAMNAGMAGTSNTTGTLVARLYARLTSCLRAANQPGSDEEIADRLDEAFRVMTLLAQAPAEIEADVDLKFAALCGRLREDLDPEDRGAVLTYLLAESLRADCGAYHTSETTHQ